MDETESLFKDLEGEDVFPEEQSDVAGHGKEQEAKGKGMVFLTKLKLQIIQAKQAKANGNVVGGIGIKMCVCGIEIKMCLCFRLFFSQI